MEASCEEGLVTVCHGLPFSLTLLWLLFGTYDLRATVLLSLGCKEIESREYMQNSWRAQGV